MLIAGVTASHATEAERFAALSGRDNATTVAQAAEVGTALTNISSEASGLGFTPVVGAALGAGANAQLLILLNRLLGLETPAGAAETGCVRLTSVTPSVVTVGAAGTPSVHFLGGTDTLVTGSTFISIPAVAYTAAGIAIPAGDGTAAYTGLTADVLARLLSHSSVRIVVAA